MLQDLIVITMFKAGGGRIQTSGGQSIHVVEQTNALYLMEVNLVVVVVLLPNTGGGGAGYYGGGGGAECFKTIQMRGGGGGSSFYGHLQVTWVQLRMVEDVPLHMVNHHNNKATHHTLLLSDLQITYKVQLKKMVKMDV